MELIINRFTELFEKELNQIIRDKGESANEILKNICNKHELNIIDSRDITAVATGIALSFSKRLISFYQNKKQAKQRAFEVYSNLKRPHNKKLLYDIVIGDFNLDRLVSCLLAELAPEKLKLERQRQIEKYYQQEVIIKPSFEATDCDIKAQSLLKSTDHLVEYEYNSKKQYLQNLEAKKKYIKNFLSSEYVNQLNNDQKKQITVEDLVNIDFLEFSMKLKNRTNSYFAIMQKKKIY